MGMDVASCFVSRWLSVFLKELVKWKMEVF
jgi:hypothetical protein